MEKLTIEQLAPYAFNGIKFILELDKPYDEFGRQRIWTCDGVNKIFGDYCITTKENNDAYPIHLCKLIVRSLSDLTKEITHNGETFVPMEKLCNDFCGRTPCNAEFGTTKILMHADNGSALKWWFVYHRNKMTFELSDDNKDMTTHVLPQYQMFQKLHEWHFDVFGLIDKGLAVDYNTVNK